MEGDSEDEHSCEKRSVMLKDSLVEAEATWDKKWLVRRAAINGTDGDLTRAD